MTDDLLAMLDRIGDDLVENQDAISDIAALPVEDDLLAIPAFLLRGTPENAEAIARGEAELANRRHAPPPARAKVKWSHEL